METHYSLPDYNVRTAEEEWLSLRDNVSSYWNGSEWVQNNHVTYAFEDNHWQPLNYQIDPNRTFAEMVGASVNGNFGGSGSGYPPIHTVPGEMTILSDSQIPFYRYWRMYRGDGVQRWRFNKITGRKYVRFYLQTSSASFGYNRRLIIFRDKDGQEIVNLSLYISGSTSEGEENRLLLMQGSNPISEGLRWVGTSEGSIRPGPWNDTNFWYRVEMMFDPGYGFVIKVFDYDGHTPRDSNTWRIPGIHLDGIHSVEINEMANSFPELRDYTRIAHIGLSNESWPGHSDLRTFVRNHRNGGNSVLSSTSCPFEMANITAQTYVLATVTYYDNTPNTSVPNIVGPAGFERLGFTYIGSTGGSIRSYMFVFGRYFHEADSTSKAFTVTGGRSGNWILNERHYYNVNPTDPIAVGWDHVPNTLRGPAGELVYGNPPPLTEDIKRGDAVITMLLTKNDAATATVFSNISYRTSPLGSINRPDFISSMQSAGTWRRNHQITTDNVFYASDGLGAPVIAAVRAANATTSAIGRIALRSIVNEPVGTTLPYPVPSTISDP